MPGKGFYTDVLCYLLKAWKRCAVPAAIASCCHGSSCALLASRLCTDSCVMLSVCVCTTTVCVFASQSRASQGRLESPKIKSGLYTKFQDQVFLLDFESRCMCRFADRFCIGICAFWRCEKLKNFLARRGSASRPARPRRLTAGAARIFVQQGKKQFLNEIG